MRSPHRERRRNMQLQVARKQDERRRAPPPSCVAHIVMSSLRRGSSSRQSPPPDNRHFPADSLTRGVFFFEWSCAYDLSNPAPCTGFCLTGSSAITFGRTRGRRRGRTPVSSGKSWKGRSERRDVESEMASSTPDTACVMFLLGWAGGRSIGLDAHQEEMHEQKGERRERRYGDG